MIYPSKKEAKLVEVARRRQDAIDNNDPEAFAQAIKEMEGLDEQPDVWTCCCCGTDFQGGHVDLLVAAILIVEEVKGQLQTVGQMDYGIQDALRGASGRRIKFCRGCVKNWKISILDYVEMR